MDPTPRLTLLDGAALVVGYGLASMLLRAYWPDDASPAPLTVGLMALVFAWLGFAMSGPVVLLTRRPPPADPSVNEIPASRTWAELAWMIIGLYWIGLTMTVVPARMNSTRLVDSAVLGVFPVAAVVVLRVFGPRRTWKNARPPGSGPAWTHRAGVALLVTWPFAWVGLILLGQKLF
ncbi:MAG: hypothetical protein U0835_25610 [Isosphaeraceae bacterium]